VCFDHHQPQETIVMTKLVRTSPAAADETEISRAVQAFTDLRREVELANLRTADLDKNLALAEQKAERLELQCERLQEQRDEAISRLVELTTIIQTIGASIDQARNGVARTVKSLNRVEQDEPPAARNGGPDYPPMPTAAELRTMGGAPEETAMS
jgi:septal ring factor EnvC (AmiA/AmiB activator)